MKSLITAAAFLCWICSATQAQWSLPGSAANNEWTSPDNTYHVTSKPDPNDALLRELFVDLKKVDDVGTGDISHEHHGLGWFDRARYRWKDNRFLIFEDRLGLGILDAKKGRFLVNNVFESFEKFPGVDRWMFVRFRGCERGGWNPEDDKDTIGTIDLDEKTLKPDDPTLFWLAHCNFRKLEGILVVPPIMVHNNARIACLQWKQGMVSIEVFGIESLKPIASNLMRLKIPPRYLQNPRFPEAGDDPNSNAMRILARHVGSGDLVFDQMVQAAKERLEKE